MNNDEFLIFTEDADSSPASVENDYWHVLVVDDDVEVHSVTRLALKNVEILGKKLKIHSAESAKQAKELLLQDVPFAVALIDVVMETDRAGLDLVHWIRTELNNHNIRLVLRTGQPGQAPIREVISNYDINDYKEKTELTANKLYILTFACIRAYKDIIALYENKKGLEAIIKSSNKIFAHQSLQALIQGVLQQFGSLLHNDIDASYPDIDFIAASQNKGKSKIIAATGKYKSLLNHTLDKATELIKTIDFQALYNQEGPQFGDNYFVGVYESRLGGKNLFFIEGIKDVTELDRQLVEIFGSNVGVAFDNHAMSEQVECTQREMVYRMSEAVESRSKETSNHVKRVALTCQYLARVYGLNEVDVDTLYKASPLHDIGKIAIPDHILNKPGKLTSDEWEIMKSHAQIGCDILASSELDILSAGSIIAGEHHENWDGSGYPKGKSGEDIHIYGRITSIADVFDALVNKRCYKQAWPIEESLNFFREMSGVKFEPSLVELVIKHQKGLIAIQEKYID